MDVLEFELLDVRNYAKFKVNHRYIVIDVFSKIPYLIPGKTKSGLAVASAFRSIFDNDDSKYSRRPVGVRIDNARNF